MKKANKRSTKSAKQQRDDQYVVLQLYCVVPVRLKPGFPLTGTQNKGEGQQRHTVKPAGHLGTMIRLSPYSQDVRMMEKHAVDLQVWKPLDKFEATLHHTQTAIASIMATGARYHIFPPFSLYFRPFFVVRVRVCDQ